MTLTANLTTRLPELGKSLLNFRLPAKPTRQRLRVRAVGTMAGWYFIIADYESRTVLHRDIGQLPDGFNFNPDTATLYALANAARWIAGNLPGAIVSIVNTAAPLPVRRGERRAA